MMNRRALVQSACASALGAMVSPLLAQTSGAFDHSYPAWNALLKKHVKWLPDNVQSRVDYKGFQADRASLQGLLDQWSAVSLAQFNTFSREQRMAFLINAYNGFTVALVLTKYPGLKSIKDIGSVFQSPWKIRFFTLLGESQHLDWIEHEQLRPKFNDPRVHAAVNCASIGCPALRPEAFTPARLDAQLDDGMRRFMADGSRNRFNAASNQVEVSSIFKWFREDFEKGHRGLGKLDDVWAAYADQLASDEAGRAKLRAKAVAVRFLDYDWSLNGIDAGT